MVQAGASGAEGLGDCRKLRCGGRNAFESRGAGWSFCARRASGMYSRREGVYGGRRRGEVKGI